MSNLSPKPPAAAATLSTLTPSGIETPTVADASMVETSDIGAPGRYPFTRSIFPDGYRGRLWTFRQYSGFGSAEETNERYQFLL